MGTGTGSVTSENVWRKTASQAPQSLEVRDIVVSEPEATAMRDLDFASPSLGVGQIPASDRSAVPRPEPEVAAGRTPAAPSLFQAQLTGLISAVRQSLKTKWFWYAMASSLCWTGWAFTAKIGSKELPPATMEFISAFGFGLVSVCVMRRKTVTTDSSQAGKIYALMSGVLLALGGISLYGAYRTGYNTSMITAVTSLYPVVTVLCAVGFLREKLNKMQVVGLLFAVAAMSILSL